MKNTLIIPKKCKVGFNERSDTFTGMLGYIIMHDGKVWRKENSWESWRYKYISPEEFESKKQENFKSKLSSYTRTFEENHRKPKPSSYMYYWEQVNKHDSLESWLTYSGLNDYNTYRFHVPKSSTNEKIKPVEFENIPTEGFVLNKKVGGNNYSWNPRQTYCRVYDPRGWEFEINIPNLLYILENTNSIKGKGLEGKFVYAWDGKDLVLVPENAPEFKEMLEFTSLQDKKIKKNELIIGGIYKFNDNKLYTFLEENYYYNYKGNKEGKKLWFADENGRIITSTINRVKLFVEINNDITKLYDSLKEYNNYKTPDVSYIPIDEELLEKWKKEFNSSYYSYRRYDKHEVFIKKRKLYKPMLLYFNKNKNQWDLTKSYREEGEQFNSIKELLEKNQLWLLQKTTN